MLPSHLLELGQQALAAVAIGVFVWRSLAQSDGSRRAAAERFETACGDGSARQRRDLKLSRRSARGG